MEGLDNRLGFSGCIDSRIGGRQENQDDYGYADTPLGVLVVVCDGMGGGPSGKTASSLARETIVSHLKSCKLSDNPKKVLVEAVIAANSALIGAIKTNHSLMGMGTTCVAILANFKVAYIVHVGDSRCYQLRKGKVAFRTSDHSYVGEMVRAGKMTEEEARQSNHSNIITKAIGINETVEPQLDVVNVKAGDRFALMSDGIWGMLPEKHLVGALSMSEDVSLVVSELADRVDAMGHNNGGHHDNLTLALMQVPQQANAKGISNKLWRFLFPTLFLLSFFANLYLLLNRNEVKSQSSSSYIDKSNQTIDSLTNLVDSLQSVHVIEQEMSAIERYSQSEARPELDNKEMDKGEKKQMQIRNESFSQALKFLSELDTLKPLKNEGIKPLEQRRGELYEKILRHLTQAKNNCDLEVDKKHVDGILQALVVKRNKLISGVDKQQRLTTQDVRAEIQKYREMIQASMK